MRLEVKVIGFGEKDGSVKVVATNGRNFSMQHYEIPYSVEVGDVLNVWYSRGF